MTDESEIRRYGNPEQPSAPPLEDMPSPDHILAAQLADRLQNLKGRGSKEDMVREHSPEKDAKLSSLQECKTSSRSCSSGSKLEWKLANWDIYGSKGHIVSNNSSALDVKPSAPMNDETPPEPEAQVMARLANLKIHGSNENVVSKHALFGEVEPSALPREETPPRPYYSPSPLEEKPASLKGHGSAEDSGNVEATGGYDSVSTSGFDWYNQQGWRGKKRPPTPPLRRVSEDSSEDEEDVSGKITKIFFTSKRVNYDFR